MRPKPIKQSTKRKITIYHDCVDFDLFNWLINELDSARIKAELVEEVVVD